MAKQVMNYGATPKHLSEIGRYHYLKLVTALQDKNLYEKLDSGALEMLASLYSDFRNPELSAKEKRESIKLYVQLIQEYGGTPTSRQKLKLSKDVNEDAEEDLKDFIKN